jgi:MFS family permease
MSPIGLGILLGIANVFANAIAMALVGPEPRGAGMLLVYGMLPGIGAGAVLGAIAGASTSRPLARFMLFASLASLVVLTLGGVFDLMEFVPTSLALTLTGCAILERSTRAAPAPARNPEPHEPHMPAARAPSAVRLAMLLGAIVMFVVMVGVLARIDDMDQLLIAYVPFGFGAGIGFAIPFGALMDDMRESRVWERRFVLLTCTFVLTGLLAAIVRLEDLALISFIPTAAGCMILERYSRPAPALAPATVHLTVRA